ncbi:hypothetical protein OSTOST_17890 [Ostertagia ostertagi]
MSLFDYFFNRSHKFRLKTVDKLQSYAIKTVKKWHEKFGPGYDKLNYVGDFLRESKAVDFDSASAELLAERLRKEAEDRKSAELSQKVVAHVRRKLDEVKDDIERCIASADTALSILVPVFCTDFEENAVKNCDNTSDPSSVQELQEKQAAHGYTSSDTISVVLESLTPEVTINENNEALLESVRDAKVMLDVYRNKILSWQRKINGAVGVELLTRDLTSFKRKIDQRCAKIAELKNESKGTDSSESEESDLEEVPEKQLEDFMPPDEVPRHIMERVQQLEKAECSEQPCCSKSLETNPPSPKQDEVKPNIPVVSYGLDLKYWGEQRCEAPIPRNNADCHRFWRAAEDDDR